MRPCTETCPATACSRGSAWPAWSPSSVSSASWHTSLQRSASLCPAARSIGAPSAHRRAHPRLTAGSRTQHASAASPSCAHLCPRAGTDPFLSPTRRLPLTRRLGTPAQVFSGLLDEASRVAEQLQGLQGLSDRLGRATGALARVDDALGAASAAEVRARGWGSEPASDAIPLMRLLGRRHPLTHAATQAAPHSHTLDSRSHSPVRARSLALAATSHAGAHTPTVPPSPVFLVPIC